MPDTSRVYVALATAGELAGGDDDAARLIVALAERGVDAISAVWDAPQTDWSRFDLVVLRSVWDYPARRELFLAWIDRVAAVSQVKNPPAVVRWNTDKRYLAELAQRGAPVVPTEWISPGQNLKPPTGSYVIKPTVSAGAMHAARFLPGEEQKAAAHLQKLHDLNKTAMLQPYIEAVDRVGETALIFLGDRFSHAVHKGAILSGEIEMKLGLFAAERITDHQATEAELAAAQRVLEALPFARSELLYARVDLVPAEDGSPLLLELELTEPSLFLAHGTKAYDCCADLIAASVC